jgi:hypothetical protein
VEDGTGAVVERVEGGILPLLRTQMGRALKRSAGSSLGSWQLELCLGKEKEGANRFVKKFLK